MPIPLGDLKFYASATVAENDVVTNIGGDIDRTKKFDFTDIPGVSENGGAFILSDATGDTTQTITFYYRRNDTGATVLSATATLNGQTDVPLLLGTGTVERAVKAVKGSSTAGNVILAQTGNVRQGTLAGQGPTSSTVILDAGASAVDETYTGMILRITGGTSNHALREIIAYEGQFKRAHLSSPLTVDSTSAFSIYKGFFFDKTPNEIMYIVRIDYALVGNAAGDPDVSYYQKGFFEHTNASGASLTLSLAKVIRFSDPTGVHAFGLDATKNATTSNGPGNNRQVAPAGITFDNNDKDVPTTQLGPNDRIGVWLRATLPNGGNSYNSFWLPRIKGRTI